MLVIAAFLRLFRLDYGQFTSDDQHPWLIGLGALQAHRLPDAGIVSSIGVPNGPAHPLLLMAAGLLSSQPMAGMILVALLNTAAVYLFYRLAQELFGRRMALIAALLFATGSWAVVLSRQMRPQDSLVPFELLFFWCAARWLVNGRGRDLVWTFVWLAVASQIYIAGLLELAMMPLVLLLGLRRIRLKPLLLGAAIWAALSARYLWVVLRQLGSLGRVGGGAATLDWGSTLEALLMADHKGFQTVAGQAGSVFDATAGFEGWLVIAEEALFAAGVAYGVVLLVRAIRERKSNAAKVYALLLAWVGLPVLAFARHAVPMQPYYFLSLLPAAYLFSALGLDRFWRRGGAILLAVLVANSLALAGIFFAVIPGYYPHADYGLPYRYTEAVARKVEALGISRVYVDGRWDAAQVLSTTLREAGLDPFWQDGATSPSLGVPAPGSQPALYLTTGADTDSSTFLQRRFGGQQAFIYPLPGEGVSIRGYVLAPEQLNAALEGLLPQKLEVHAANGLALQAFGGDFRLTPGQPLRAQVAWSWPGGARPAEQQYTLFAHLLDPSQKPVAQLELPLPPSSDWRAGQRMLQWLDLAVPASASPGRYALELGVYATEGAVRQALTDGSGKAIGSSLDAGPFIVPPPPAPPASGDAEAQLGDGITLLGYQTSWSGGKLSVQLTWGASARPSKDYTVFVHVLDAGGKLVAQADSQPRGGSFPTGVWLPGDRVADDYSLALPAGKYTVQVGMYELASLKRLGSAPVTFAIDAH